MSADLYLAVGAGGLVGAPSRYLLDRAVTQRSRSELPWGTFVINITGSLLLGLLTGLSLKGNLPDAVKALVGTGFCGAYTTFSTFSFETVALIEDGRFVQATANVVMSVTVGLGAAAAGIGLGLLS